MGRDKFLRPEKMGYFDGLVCLAAVFCLRCARARFETILAFFFILARANLSGWYRTIEGLAQH
jgi:hypothetical protein